MVQKYTFTYSRVCNIAIEVDIYLPERTDASDSRGINETDNERPPIIPSVIYFHGGGLTAGNRMVVSELFKNQVLESSLAFISADYRLLFPFSARHILEDVLALFTYLSTAVNGDILSTHTEDKPSYLISDKLFAVAGASSGAYPARLAALYAKPRPRAFFSLYGAGGDLLSPFYIKQPPMSGWESSLGLAKMFLKPSAQEKETLLPGVSDCPMDPESPNINFPGHHERTRVLYIKMLEGGIYLDHLMGYPGLGEMLYQAGSKDSPLDSASQSPILRTVSISRGTSSSSGDDERIRKQKIEAAVPEMIRHLFPQLNITDSFPPTYLVHGTNDRAVACRESKEMAKKLCEVGVKVEIVLAGGLGHAFDCIQEPGGSPVDVLYNRYIGDVVPFLKKHLMSETR